MRIKKTEVSKRQYSSKAKNSNVRDFLPVIGTVHVSMHIPMQILNLVCTKFSTVCTKFTTVCVHVHVLHVLCVPTWAGTG